MSAEQRRVVTSLTGCALLNRAQDDVGLPWRPGHMSSEIISDTTHRKHRDSGTMPLSPAELQSPWYLARHVYCCKSEGAASNI